MFYLPIFALLVFGTVALCRRDPRRLTKIGLSAVPLGIVAVTIAVLTGNFPLAYLGVAAVYGGLIILLVRAVDTLCQRRGARPLFGPRGE